MRPADCGRASDNNEETDEIHVVIPIYGVLMDVLGRKMAMLTACLFFAEGTIGCALSGNMFVLIAMRAVAGVRVFLSCSSVQNSQF